MAHIRIIIICFLLTFALSTFAAALFHDAVPNEEIDSPPINETQDPAYPPYPPEHPPELPEGPDYFPDTPLDSPQYYTLQ